MIANWKPPTESGRSWKEYPLSREVVLYGAYWPLVGGGKSSLCTRAQVGEGGCSFSDLVEESEGAPICAFLCAVKNEAGEQSRE